MADWANLPLDILLLIALRMECIEDFLCFCFVCKSWQIVTSILGNKPGLPPRFPWVMLPEAPESNIEGPETRRFYSFSTSKTYEFELPEVTGRKCGGVNHGCLLTVGCDLQINLLHPFSRQHISLPPLLTFKEQFRYDDKHKPQDYIFIFVSKVVMSRNPHDDLFFINHNRQEDCTVVAMYGTHRLLAFARPGDELWTDIEIPFTSYADIIYHNGTFYVLDCHGVLFICDLDNAKAIAISPRPNHRFGPHTLNTKYLVESSGDLLLVSRIRHRTFFEGYRKINFNHSRLKRFSTIGFSVFRLEECHGENEGIDQYPYRWTEVKNLGGRALFLGSNVSVSLSSSEYVKPNCIYFAEDESRHYDCDPDGGGGQDTGMFDMEKNTLESHYAAKFSSLLSPPIWYI